MARFEQLGGVFGLLPTPYDDDHEIHGADLSAAAEFCCATGQSGIVWPVMVGEFYYVGEEERVRNLDTILQTVNGRVPVVFGCSGQSVPQVLLYARAAQRAGADAVIAMPPAGVTSEVAISMYHRIADAYDGPIILQNAIDYSPLSTDQVRQVVDEVPSVEYIKEERPPGPRHISEVHRAVGDRVKGIFGGVGGRLLPEELARGATGCMPACQLGDVLAKVYDRWRKGDEAGARELHQRLLPLIVRENHPFMRYVLRRRGVFTSTGVRVPARVFEPDAEARREISILLEAVADEIDAYPFGPE